MGYEIIGATLPCEGMWNTQKGLNEERLQSGLFTKMGGGEVGERLRNLRNYAAVPRNQQQWGTFGTLSLERMRVGGGGWGTMIPEPGKGWSHGRGLQLLSGPRGHGMDLRKMNTLISPPHTFPSSAGTCIGWRCSKSQVRLPDADSGREGQRMNLGSGE